MTYVLQLSKSVNLLRTAAAALLLCGFGLQPVSAIVFEVYIGAPRDMVSNLTGITEETFEGLPQNDPTWADDPGYSSPLGTYETVSGTSNILANTIYGAGTGDYMSLQPNAIVSLELSQPVAYFGFAWPAGDDLNIVTIYNNGTEIFKLRTADIIDFLDTDEVFAVDNSPYNTAEYYGNPLTGANPGEPYGYIHIVGADLGSTFDQVTFSHERDGGQFETDNHAVLFGAVPTVQGDWVYAYDSSELVPEPSSYALITGIVALAWISQRRSRTRA